jgi:hypothetical protein
VGIFLLISIHLLLLQEVAQRRDRWRQLNVILGTWNVTLNKGLSVHVTGAIALQNNGSFLGADEMREVRESIESGLTALSKVRINASNSCSPNLHFRSFLDSDGLASGAELSKSLLFTPPEPPERAVVNALFLLSSDISITLSRPTGKTFI